MDRWQAMETLVQVVEAGSFSGAARRLDVGQPAVSKIIAQLESDLGVQLLLRSSRGLTPTQPGLAYYQGARQALMAAAEADASARCANTELGGRLVVSAPVTFARLHVVPVLHRFLSQHPQLHLDIMLDDRNIDLLEGGVDVALRLGTLSDSDMTARRIGRCPLAVLATPEYLSRNGEPEHPAELTAHSAIIYHRTGNGPLYLFQRGDVQESVALQGRMRVSAAEGVRAAVLSNMGLTIASEWMFEPEIASGQVRRVLQDWALPAVDLWAVFSSGRKASAKARAFAAFVEESLAL
ncbi:LysR family transcriptional regulator [Duganella sp. FT80W]|uniref:LysR family transcriptional regulator n=1 Tax=Duganella guangzhouensis TaxID=2666084 RepID=A0A6I2L442_9BURK|nr:LysR family transcriptional regulator [Duganella guangzhouensis]MRW92911.1 LysR family transcriptional regulator [Duganella guangzhouensis]